MRVCGFGILANCRAQREYTRMGGGLASLPGGGGGGGCRGEGARGTPLILKLEAEISDHSATAGFPETNNCSDY